MGKSDHKWEEWLSRQRVRSLSPEEKEEVWRRAESSPSPRPISPGRVASGVALAGMALWLLLAYGPGAERIPSPSRAAVSYPQQWENEFDSWEEAMADSWSDFDALVLSSNDDYDL